MPERNLSVTLTAEQWDAIRAERLNETGRGMITLAQKVLEATTRDNVLARVQRAQALVETSFKADKADADRKLVEIEEKIRKRNEKAKKAQKLRAV